MDSFTTPCYAINPLVSKESRPSVCFSTARSIRLLAGPQSHPWIEDRRSGPDFGGMIVMFAIPPRFRTPCHACPLPIRATSVMGTKGAPWPPKAISAALKSYTTFLLSSCASREGWSNWRLFPKCSFVADWCQTVCPWQPMSSASPLGSQDCAASEHFSVIASDSSSHSRLLYLNPCPASIISLFSVLG